jgi:hypothetical protein
VAFPVEDEDLTETPRVQSDATRRFLGEYGVRVGQRRRFRATGSLVAAAVIVMSGWLVLRPAGSAPAGSNAATAAVAGASGSAPAVAEAVAALPPSIEVVPVEVPRDPDPASSSALEESGGFVGPGPLRVTPRIVSVRPDAGALDVPEGALVEFGIRATNGDTGERLTHAWFLDGQRVGRRASWRFSAPYGGAGSTHTVEVEVADATGARSPRLSWAVQVVPRMSEANVHDWLARLAAAVERKDIATLRLYGLVSDDAEGEAFRKQVSRHKATRVSIDNESIATDGRYAHVTFDLAELDEDGTRLATHGASFELEKHPTGFVGLRAR